MPSAWSRPAFEAGGRPAEIELVALARASLDTAGPLALVPEGYTVDAVRPDLAILDAERAHAPDWFDHVVAEGVATLSGDPLVAAATHAWIVRGDIPDPADLDHLRCAWAVGRWFLRRGAVALLDASAGVWWPAAMALAEDPADPGPASRVSLREQAAPGGDALVLYTRGNGKFGRPELVAIVPRGDDDRAAARLFQITESMILGQRFAPGDVLQSGDGVARLKGYVGGFDGPEIDDHFAEQPLLVRFDA